MRTRSSLLSIFAALGTAASAHAQQLSDVPRAFAGGNLQVAQPVGEFGDYVDTGFGVSGHFMYALDRDRTLGLRVEGGFVNYGHERRQAMLSPTIGGRITVDLNTSNNIVMLGVGPQLMLPSGRLRPYAYGTAGLAYFVTESSLTGNRGGSESFANTTNYDDLTLAYGGGAGLYIPVTRGRNPVSIDLGTRFHRNGRASYLREGDIRDNPDGSITLSPVHSEADLMTFHVGVSVGISPDDDDRDDDRERRGRRRR